MTDPSELNPDQRLALAQSIVDGMWTEATLDHDELIPMLLEVGLTGNVGTVKEKLIMRLACLTFALELRLRKLRNQEGDEL